MIMFRFIASALLACSIAKAGAAQLPASADSDVVRRILLAEDRRDVSDPVLKDGTANGDPKIQLLARRAIARIGDPKFASRDSFPALPAPPSYADPAWRLRYRALHAGDCAALRGALADSVWHVRLHAMDLVTPACGSDTALVRSLVAWVRRAPPNAARLPGTASWQPAAHALVALARTRP